jgi:hypothetical protein
MQVPVLNRPPTAKENAFRVEAVSCVNDYDRITAESTLI